MSEANDNQPVEEVPLVVAATPEVATDDTEVKAAEEIQIGDKTFTSNEEAIAYARELQSASATNDAYQQGINDAIMNQPQVQSVTNEPVVEAPLFDDAEFYENPQAVIKRVTEQAQSNAVDIIRKENTQKQKADELWGEFYNKYPKLRKSDKMVKRILDDNWNVLGQMPDGSKAMDILAQKATDQIKLMISDFMPGQELPETKQATSPGSQTNVTPVKVDDPVLDFVAQAAQHYKL